MRERIRAAVEMVLGNMGDGWFLIIEEPENEKFVQFALDEESGLIFDLPFQALNTEEIARATEALGGMGIAPVVVGDYSSFQADIGTDVDRAADIVMAVFSGVYTVDADCSLNITINR